MKHETLLRVIYNFNTGYFSTGLMLVLIQYTVDSRYLEVQGTLWITLRYLYLDISDLQNWVKKKWIENHISQMNM